jgi:hypothetical protein
MMYHASSKNVFNARGFRFVGGMVVGLAVGKGRGAF